MRIHEMEFGAAPAGGARGTDSVQGHALLRLAHSTIGLSQVAPRLTALAATRQSEAETQAARARDVSTLTREMTTALGHTLQVLYASAAEISELTGLIRTISMETSLIAVNTSIAAARAGTQGKVFSVLANEIRALSDKTTAAARHVEGRIGRLQDSMQRTARVAGLEIAATAERKREDGMGLGWLLDRMTEAQASAERQAREARELTALGGQLRGLSEEMIRSVGAFRLDAHRRAEAIIERLRDDADLCSGDGRRRERALRNAVESCPFIELAYATDLRGTQITENVSRMAFSASYGSSGTGKNWSARPWFRGALSSEGIFSSDIYRSAATDEFCLTVSATFGSASGGAYGVVALDVNFRQILGDAG